MPKQSLDAGDMEACRSALPALQNKHYFNFGGQGTMPQESLDAIMEAYRQVQRMGPFSGSIFHWIVDELDSTRSVLADEFGGKLDCYAITQNVTEGCNIAAWGIDWEPGDVLLITDCEHASLTALAQTLAERRGVIVETIDITGITDDEIVARAAAKLKQKTKLFAFSHVLWNTGAVLPVERLTEVAHRNGTRVLVDGAQSIGALPVDMLKLGVDYYAFTGHKWLCGPEGVGGLYIREDQLEKLKRTFVGWRSMEMPGQLEKPTASHFEVATTAFPLLAGLKAAIKFHSKWGTAVQRWEKLKSNAIFLRTKLEERSQIKCVLPEPSKAGLVSFTVEGSKPQDIAERCESRGYFVRTIPHPECIRASVHYFSTEDELDGLVKNL